MSGEKTINTAEKSIVTPKESVISRSVGKQSGERNWYVIHTYAGYEDQVAEQIKQRVDTLGLEEKVFNVIVPKQKEIEIKGGKKKVVEKRIYPGYVFVDMIVTDDSWYVVRNTPNVTGFIGLGVRPTPMSVGEVEKLKLLMQAEEPKYNVEFDAGDLVRISDGPLKSFEGKITEVDHDKGKVKVVVSMFGRETPVTMDFLQVKKI
jgi:transcriptional antiterminator NusG